MGLKTFKKLIFAVALIAGGFLYALEVPALTGRVVDNAGIISSSDTQEITEYLEKLENSTGIQIAVLTVPSLEGDDIAAFGIRVAEKWQLGQKDADNGALLIVAYDEHQIRIETGYGLEGTLTDAACGLIIRNVIIPEFRSGNYSQGIVKGVKNMGGVASEDAELVDAAVRQDSSNMGMAYIIIWLIFVFIVITSRGGLFKWLFLSRLFDGGKYTTHIPTQSSSYGSFSHTSNIGGGSFGGGSHFSGGGGHFGGGGASGHW